MRTVRQQGNRTIVAFEEATDRDAADALAGAELVITASDARELGSDEYWDHDLVGCTVVTNNGAQVGHVTDVLHQAANDILNVQTPHGDRLIPLTRNVVRSIDPGHTIVIEPLPGLLEDDG